MRACGPALWPGSVALRAGLAALLAACGTTDRHAEPIVLRFDSGASTSSAPHLHLGPLPLTARIDDTKGGLPGAALVVWTGEAEVAEGCEHPTAQPPLLGHLAMRDRGLVFEPRLGFSPGLTYTACADPGLLADGELSAHDGTLHLVFRVPDSEAAPPTVTAVWPPPGPVPANLLRLYVSFSEPMQTAGVASSVSLSDESGPIDEAFVDVPNGLWDVEDRRLTLFLHPGRIKRGVGPRERLGPALEAGMRVTLRIAQDLRSKQGTLLADDFEAHYRVSPPDRESPEPSRWRIESPASPDSALRIVFDEPLDLAQLGRFAAVVSSRDETLSGSQRAAPDGRSWLFEPTASWPPLTTYTVEVRRDVEDLAGNRPGRPFDVDTRGIPAPPPGEPTAPGGGVDDEPLRLSFATADWDAP